MIFENEYLRFDILDVLYLDQGNVNSFNKWRPFDALTLRLSSDAVLKQGDREICASDGAVCFIPAGLDYERRAVRDECIVVHFKLDAPAVRSIDMIFPADREKTQELFFNILNIWQEKKDGYKYKATAILYEIFAELHIPKREEEKQGEKIRAGIEYINSCYNIPDVSVSEAARRSFMCEAYFRKLFFAEFRTTPKKYIINLRMQKAISLINTGYYSLKEVAAMCGFTDYKYFSVEFKKHTGKSPSEYEYKFP